MDISKKEALKMFNHLYKELDDIYHKLALKAELSDSAFCILYAIACMGDGCLQKDISEYFFQSRQTINSSVKNLEKKGYLSLVRGNSKDKHIHLTTEGQRLVKDKITPVIETEEAAFASMTVQDRQELLRLTEQYIRLFQNKTDQIL